MQLLNFCVLYAKYYISIRCLFNNTLKLHTCLTQLKQALKIEENIYIQNNKKEKLFKYNVIYDNL